MGTLGVRVVAAIASVLLCAHLAGAQTTTRVSLSSSGFEANGAVGAMDVTPDGRFIAFYSDATNLTAEGKPGIFWRDLLAGSTVFVGLASNAPLMISDDGQVVIYTGQTPPAPGGGFQANLFFWEQAGRTIEQVGTEPVVSYGSISGNGRYIGYAGQVYDRAERRNISVGFSDPSVLRLTADGSFAVLTRPIFGPGGSFRRDVYRINVQTGQSTLVATNADGTEGSGDSLHQDISADGRFVLFVSTSTNFPGTRSGTDLDLFLKDTQTGTLTQLNVSPVGQRFEFKPGFGGASGRGEPAISADGRWITFTSSASNIVPGDTNGIDDAFLYDRLTGEFTRVSVPAAGGQAQSGASYSGNATLDGRVLFGSTAHNMVPGDTNFAADVFLRDLNGAPPCTVTIDPSGLAVVTNSGGNGSIAITAQSGCAWTATATVPWIRPTNMTSGLGDGTVSYNFDPYFGGTTIRSGAIVINTAAHGLRQLGEITQPPFGFWETPSDGTTVSGAIPITGWALDDVQVGRIRVYRAPLGGIGDLIYVGDAVKVAGARPDVAAVHHRSPYNVAAGWGLLVLTNMLPNQGNGEFTFYVYVDDVDGHTTSTGSRRVTATNATATAPFGTIDTPMEGQTVSGTIVNFGWALTPQSGMIPTNGSTIDVFIDGVNVGHPTYNQPRSDIASLFPGYANSNGPVGYFYIDTTVYADGVHTIAWVVTDSLGRASGIGSRYFTIQNGPNPVTPPYLRRNHLPMRR